MRRRLTRLRPRSQDAVRRAQDAATAAVEHVRVDHRRRDIAMPEQLLDGADVVPSLEQMRREAVAQRVRADGLDDAGVPAGLADGTLNDGFVLMVAPGLPGAGI